MLSRRVLLASVVTMLTTVACGNASFFGGGSAKSKKETSPSGQTPGGQTPNGQTTTDQSTNGSTPNGSTPNGQIPSGTTPNGQTQTPQIGPNSQITQPNANTIVFGRDKVFHIGDGRYEKTSCKEKVSELPLNGTAYFFQFEVLADNTSVNVNMGNICGIDYNTNAYELYSGNYALQRQAVPVTASTLAGSAVTLKKGIYTIVLTSGRDNIDRTTDRDDFIVGQVTVQGNQAVRPIQYGAYNR